MDVHPALGAAFASLDRAGVTWVLLRGRERLDCPTGDVDLLVDAEAGVLRRALEGAGLLHLRTWARGVQHFFRAADDTGWTVIVQAVTEMTFGPYGCFHTTAAPALLRRRRHDGAVWLLDPGDEFWVTTMHAYLDKGAVDAKHRARLQELAVLASVRGELAGAVDRATGGGAAGLVGAIAAGRWHEADRIGTSIAHGWFRAVPLRTAASYAMYRASLVARKAAEPVRWPGLIVAILAPDGAGKSTLVRALGATLPLPAVSLYGGAYGAAVTGRALRIPGARFASRVALLAFAGARARWARRRRRIAIFDRHPMEIEPKGPRRALLRATAPRPDLVIVLDAPGELLAARSGEHDARTLDRMRARYAALAGDHEAVAVIDATAAPDDVAAAARRAIWSALRARHRS